MYKGLFAMLRKFYKYKKNKPFSRVEHTPADMNSSNNEGGYTIDDYLFNSLNYTFLHHDLMVKFPLLLTELYDESFMLL